MNKSDKKWALPFAAWELRLYLDTHPGDLKALAAYKQLCAALGDSGYACGDNALGDGSSCPICDGEWSFIKSPWPWMLEANLTEGECK